MTSPAYSTEQIVEGLADIDGVLRDDIHVSDSTVTTYVPIDRLESAEKMEGVDVEVLEEHEHEYLIKVEPKR